MRFNCGPTITILLFLLSITGCATVNTPAPAAAFVEAPAIPPPRNANDDVVETLVTTAFQLGTLPVPIDVEEDGAIPPGMTTTVPMTANRLVERAINDLLQNSRGVLRTWASRSHVYFPMIEKTFAEEGVPDELKYLALQESSLNPTVRSSAGAVGLWQFMAATAKSEGLRIDSWVDERRDPEKATRAAAKHLKALNESYQGSWHLSLAGYNCSYRCIMRSVEKAGRTIENPPTFWEIYPHLPQQTREFVPRFIAASLIVSNPEQYGIHVDDLGQELAYDIVKVQGMLGLDDAAKYAGTDLATIRNLNPSLLKASLPDGTDPYELKIPLGSFDRFVSAFHARPPTGTKGAGEYEVKNGDSLDRIARNYKINIEDLRRANNMSNNLIHAKQKLLLPGLGSSRETRLASDSREFVAYNEHNFKPIKLGQEFQLVRQSGSTEREPLMAVSLSQADPDEGALSLVPTIYKVRPGDSLGSISRRFGVSIASIQKGNNLKGNALRPSQELTIHAAAEASTSVVAEAAAAEKKKSYEVQLGDSLSDIARRFRVSVDNIKRWNRLSDNRIFPGMSLLVN